MTKLFYQVKLSSEGAKSYSSLFRHFNLSSILKKCGISKKRGVPVQEMLHLILLLILESSKSVNQGIIRNHCNSMKTPVNDMLNNISYNWRNFLFCFARIFAAISFNHHKDKGTLIIDDTCKKKSGNKVQHLSWFYDHANDEYFTGFQNVTCAWCNGRSTIPIDFEFKIGNKKTKHATKSDYARGSHAEQRVRFAKQKKTEIAIQMIKRAFQRNFPINYILWDS